MLSWWLRGGVEACCPISPQWFQVNRIELTCRELTNEPEKFGMPASRFRMPPARQHAPVYHYATAGIVTDWENVTKIPGPDAHKEGGF